MANVHEFATRQALCPELYDLVHLDEIDVAPFAAAELRKPWQKGTRELKDPVQEGEMSNTTRKKAQQV